MLSNINLLCITKSQTLTKYGPNVILEPVLKDIKFLEQVQVNISDLMIIIFVEWVDCSLQPIRNEILWFNYPRSRR